LDSQSFDRRVLVSTERSTAIFSDNVDQRFRSWVHTSPDTIETNATEARWRKYSDLGVFGLIVGAVGTPLFEVGGVPRRQILAVSRAFALNNLTTSAIKSAVHRSRPKPARYPEHSQNGDDAKSFPSGHASNAMVAATSLSALNPDWPMAAHFAVYVGGASIGFARITADRHNFTDVLVGGAIGYGITRWTMTTWTQENFSFHASPQSAMIEYRF
jgi:membrane-associated phospholipid phosphatase